MSDRAEFQRLEPIAREKGYLLRKLTKSQQDNYPGTHGLVSCDVNGGECTKELAADHGSVSTLHTVEFSGSLADVARQLGAHQ